MRLRARIDNNQVKIVAALRAAGICSVQSLAVVGHGVPDLLVGYQGVNLLFEVKNPDGENRLTENQVLWHRYWKGQVLVVRSVAEALAAIGVTSQ